MNSRLFEIEAEEQQVRQIIAEALSRLSNLGNERQAILTMTVSRSGPSLTFDQDGKTIRWDGGEATLGGKSFKFVKALWFAKKRRLRTDQLGEQVWGAPSTPTETIRNFIWRLETKLVKARFPFTVKALKNGKTLETMGYGLRVAK